MKKIAIISSYGQSLISFRGELIKDLSSSNIRVFALAPDLDARMKEELINLGAQPVDYKMSRVGVNPIADFLSFLSIFAQLKNIKPNIVLSYFVKPVVYGSIAAWLLGVPRRIAMIEGLGYVFTYPIVELSQRVRLLRFLVTSMYRISLKLVDKIVFLNQDDRFDFLKLKLVNLSNSVCIGGIGIDLNKWRQMPASSVPTVFLMVARLLREKGVNEYAQAAKYVKLKYPETHFLLLGGLDTNPGSIQLEQVSAWHEQGVLTWYGHVPVAEYMKAASVFVLPSYREGVPVSTMEAMAMGRPVITTDVPGCRETVVNGVNGFLVPAQDAIGLAEKMIWFIENASSIPAMGAASRKMAEEKFDVHEINAKLMEIMLCDEDKKTV